MGSGVSPAMIPDSRANAYFSASYARAVNVIPDGTGCSACLAGVVREDSAVADTVIEENAASHAGRCGSAIPAVTLDATGRANNAAFILSHVLLVSIVHGLPSDRAMASEEELLNIQSRS